MFVPTIDRPPAPGLPGGAPSSPGREKYLAGAVGTASPAKLLVMLYDRLLLDLERAEVCLRDTTQPIEDRRSGSSAYILHAQEIVMELRSSLDAKSGWEGAAGLTELYNFLFQQLVQANVSMDADRIAASRSVVEPLRDAWRQAAIDLAVAAAS